MVLLRLLLRRQMGDGLPEGYFTCTAYCYVKLLSYILSGDDLTQQGVDASLY